MSKIYTSKFYDYINAGSTRSAKAVVPKVLSLLGPESILDIGCGAGAWCRVWKDHGIQNILGMDGDYVDNDSLLIPNDCFIRANLSTPININQKFDLVTSLEVAEHIDEKYADIFINNLITHGDVILFSAAVPGQGGEFHINEQPLEYWRKKFYDNDYECFDPIRKQILNLKQVEPWYRYNVLLYVKRNIVPSLPESITSTAIHKNEKIQTLAPLSWRIRNRILYATPSTILNMLVFLKHGWVRWRSHES